MKAFKKTKLAAAVGTAVLASAVSAPASAVTWSGNDGWEVSYTGFVNLFYNQHDFDTSLDGTPQDSANLNEGLLPSFHTMKAKSPTVGGLTGTSQITFAIDTSTDKSVNLNKGTDGLIDLREVFFNVEGSFGTISVGRTLALYQRQAILKDMTLFGMGALASPDANGTGLGRIGFGYVYPDFRARFLWQSPVWNGFQISAGIFQPREFIGAAGLGPVGVPGVTEWETDTPQFQTEATYNTTFEGGSLGLWAGGTWQEQEVAVGSNTDDLTSAGWNIGADVSFGGFNLVGSYFDGEALGDILQGGLAVPAGNCAGTSCEEAENDGFYVQGSYTFNGKTKLGISYGENNQDFEAASATHGAITGIENTMWTVGVYHDINSWLKVIAEYNDYEIEVDAGPGPDITALEADGFSVGAFMFW